MGSAVSRVYSAVEGGSAAEAPETEGERETVAIASSRYSPQPGIPTPGEQQEQDEEGVKWAAVAMSLKRQQFDQAVLYLSADASLKKQLNDPMQGQTEHDRLCAVVSTRYFAAVRDQSHADAARFAVLYSLSGGNIQTAMQFLKQHMADALLKHHQTQLQHLRAALLPLDTAASASPSLAPGSEAITIPLALAKLFEMTHKIIQNHAYADQAFSTHNSLALLKHLQPIVDAATCDYIRLYEKLRKWDEIDADLKRGRFPDSLRDTSSMADTLDEFAAMSQIIESYKWSLRRQYEAGIEQLQERGWTFFSDSVEPDMIQLRKLNINNYIYEPKDCYEALERSSAIYLAVGRLYLTTALGSALSYENDSSNLDHDTTTGSLARDVQADQSTVSAGIDATFVVLQRVVERAFVCRNYSILEKSLGIISTEGFSKLFEFLLNRVREHLPSSTIAAITRTSTTGAGSVSSLLKNTFAKVTNAVNPTHSGSSNTTPYVVEVPRMIPVFLNDLVVSAQYLMKLITSLPRFRQVYWKLESPDESTGINLLISQLEHQCKLLSESSLTKMWTAMADSLQWQRAYSESIASLKTARYDINTVDPEHQWPKALVDSVRNHIWQPLKSRLLPKAQEALLDYLISFICSEIIECIQSKRVSYIGAIQMDADCRRLFVLFSEFSSQPMRSKFTKLRQLTSLLSMESLADVEESWAMTEDPALSSAVVPDEEIEQMSQKSSSNTSPSRAWQVTAVEVKRLLKCRLDFSPAAVDRVALS